MCPKLRHFRREPWLRRLLLLQTGVGFASCVAFSRQITAARFSLPWLAATAAAPAAAVPMNGTPAHEAVTARNSSRYCHHALPAPATTILSRSLPSPAG